MEKPKLEKYLSLKIQGFQSKDIAKEMNTSVQTISKYNKDFEKEIADHKTKYTEKLIDKYQQIEIKNYISLINISRNAYKELQNKDYANLTVKELINIIEIAEKTAEKMKSKSISYEF